MACTPSGGPGLSRRTRRERSPSDSRHAALESRRTSERPRVARGSPGQGPLGCGAEGIRLPINETCDGRRPSHGTATRRRTSLAEGTRAERRGRARMERESPESQRIRAKRAFQRLLPSERFLRRSSAVEGQTKRQPQPPIGQASMPGRWSAWWAMALPLHRAAGALLRHCAIRSAVLLAVPADPEGEMPETVAPLDDRANVKPFDPSQNGWPRQTESRRQW